MNKSINTAIALFALVVAASCAKEKDYYNAETNEPYAGIEDDVFVLDGKTESAQISMSSNIWWTAEVQYESGTTEEWCQISPVKGFGDVKIDVTSTRNYQATAERTAKIIVKGDDKNTEFRKEFTVKQKASEAYIEVEDIKDVLEVPIVRSVNSISVKSNNDWTAVSDQDWCTLDSDGKAGANTLSLTCAINTTGTVREAIVNITSKSKPELKASFKVSQSDEFGVTIVEVEKTPSTFKASWQPVVGAAKYEVLVKKIDGNVVALDAGTDTEMDLAENDFFKTPEYAGHVEISVKTCSEDPAVFSISEAKEANSHFTSGKGTQEDPFIIGEKESLENITKANKVLAGAYYKLDFTPSMSEFTPLCSKDDAFAGKFDGNGVTITGWKPTVMADQTNRFAFFNTTTEGAEIKNLNFSNCTLSLKKGDGSISESNCGIAFVAGYNNGKISNIRLNGCSVETEAGTTPLYVGGITGQNKGEIASCTTSGGRISAASDRNSTDKFMVGGITGYNYEGAVIKECVNGNEILAMDIVGGIAGYNDGQVLNCGNTGQITANYYFGGITGYVKTTGTSKVLIKDCWNKGKIIMDEPAGKGRGAAYMGGITSRVHSTGDVIVNCWNSGEMVVGTSVSSSNMRIGGITGHVNNKGNVRNCYFCGEVTIAGKVNYGGIVGEFADKACTIENCYSVGKVKKADTASGNICDAFGKLAASAVVKSCYALKNGGSKFMDGTTTKVSSECGYKTEEELKTVATFQNWDFSTVWEMKGYPQLKTNPQN